MKSIYNIYILIAIFVFLILFSSKAVNAQEYYEVKVGNGDGILSILRKYQLLDFSCNLDKFLEINNLKRESDLKLGKNYKLPLLIYKYNDISIRSTIDIKDLDAAIRIRDYNYTLLDKNLVKRKFEKSRELLVPYSEMNCRKNRETDSKVTTEKSATTEKGTEDTIKPEKENKKQKDSIINVQYFKQPKGNGLNRYVPLFGSKWATVPLEDNRLENRVFYILTGHGGPDPGAICTDSEPMLCEDEYAYDVSLRLARNLMQHGATVHVIVQDHNDGIRDERYLPCDNDEVTLDGIKIPISQKKRLKQRTNDVNNLYSFYNKKKNVKSQTLIEVHVDSRHSDQRIDVFFSYPKGSKPSEKLANNMQKTFAKKYSQHQSDRGYGGTSGQQNFYVINNSLPTAILVELANIKNSRDHERILNSFNRQALANWMFEAILDTYN
ncbi:MAG: N-acetylmuramoyl-L-alanine amidase [Saprospiraceae bacterium]|nr:N-acetylmuramoyl-L-alanine amidase [Saprospiraceae bacterium]